MFYGPTSRLSDFVIACKGCREHIAAPVKTMPDTWIIHTCPLCGERRRYLPAEIFMGRLSHRTDKSSRQQAAQKKMLDLVRPDSRWDQMG